MSIDTSNRIENHTSTAHSVAAGSSSVAIAEWNLSRVLRDYVELTKPRILIMILLTVAVAIVAVPNASTSIWVFLHAMIGTGLIAASASVLNQWMESQQDAMMPRTAKRPLPDGRLTSFEAALLGWILGIVGTFYLAILTNPTAALIGLLTWALYVWIYTPMKRFSVWNTAVGTIPGAMPILIGWTANGGSLYDAQGWLLTLFGVLWQFPHFMAIAWMYREQYDRAGYRMMTNVEPSGWLAAWHAIIPALALIPVVIISLHPENLFDWSLAALGVLSCLGQIKASFKFMKQRTTQTARKLLHSSLIFLPSFLTLVVVRSFL